MEDYKHGKKMLEVPSIVSVFNGVPCSMFRQSTNYVCTCKYSILSSYVHNYPWFIYAMIASYALQFDNYYIIIWSCPCNVILSLAFKIEHSAKCTALVYWVKRNTVYMMALKAEQSKKCPATKLYIYLMFVPQNYFKYYYIII